MNTPQLDDDPSALLILKMRNFEGPSTYRIPHKQVRFCQKIPTLVWRLGFSLESTLKYPTCAACVLLLKMLFGTFNPLYLPRLHLSVSNGSWTHVMMWTREPADLIFSIIFTFAKRSASHGSSADKETHIARALGGGSHISVPVFMSLHSWWHKSPVKLLQTHKSGSFIFKSLCVCHVRTVCMDGCPRLPPPPLYAWRADSYMCSFTLGGAPHNHWPIYWHTQEAPHCHGTQGSRYRKKKKKGRRLALAKVVISVRRSRFWAGRIELPDRFLLFLFRKAGKSLRDLIEL